MNENDPDNRPSQETGLIGNLGNRPMIIQMIVVAGIIATAYAAVGGLLGLVIAKVYGGSGGEILSDAEGFLAEYGNRLNPYRWLQMLSTVLIFGSPAVIISWLYTRRPFGYFRGERGALMSDLLLVPLIMLLAFPVISMVYSYVSEIPLGDRWVEFLRMEEQLEIFMGGMLGDPSVPVFLLNFVMIALLPAVFEELLFRGILTRLFTKATANAHIGILLSGILFGLVHGQLFKFLPIAVLGILLGYLYWWTKNLWVPIFAHFFHNGIQVVAYFLVARGLIQTDLESPEIMSPWQTLLCTVFFVAVLFLFYNVNRKTADEGF